MIRFLDKDKELSLLEDLFELLYRNMESVTPMDNGYDEERVAWIRCIGAALQKPPRQILLLYAGENMVGFCMYYICADILMIEELQVEPAYQKTLQSAELFRFLRRELLPRAQWLEAYADCRNTESQKLMKKLGMGQIGDDGKFLHFRIRTENI